MAKTPKKYQTSYINAQVPKALLQRIGALGKVRAVTRDYPWLNKDIVRVALEEWADREERRQQREEGRGDDAQ